MNKAATVSVSDLLNDAENQIPKMRFLIGSLIEDYFGEYNAEKAEEQIAIVYDFKRFAPCAELIRDTFQTLDTKLTAAIKMLEANLKESEV